MSLTSVGVSRVSAKGCIRTACRIQSTTPRSTVKALRRGAPPASRLTPNLDRVAIHGVAASASRQPACVADPSMPKPHTTRLDAHQVECTKLLRANAERHSLHRVFSDFCEMSAIAISNSVDRGQFAVREPRYLQIAGAYSAAELQRFACMLGCLTLSLEEERKDFLGRLFMSLELGNPFAGQFFTPFEVSRLMAQMTLCDLTPESVVERGGFVTMCEPACGSGGMCIAIADVMAERGLNFQRCVHVTAVDIDATAVHMAYIQLSLLHLPAIVVHGNSLALEVRGHWVTPSHVLGGWDRRLRGRDEGRAVASDVTLRTRRWTSRRAFAAPWCSSASSRPTSWRCSEGCDGSVLGNRG
jgi:hypothetical protein